MTTTFIGAGARVQSAGAATLTPTKPTVLGQSGVLVCVVASKNNAVHSTATGGWTKISQTDSGASFTMSVFIAAEGAANPVITWAGSVACSARICYYAAPKGTSETTVIGGSTVNAGLTSTHSTASFNTTRDQSLVVYIDCAAANTGLATPAGWTEDSDAGSATDAGVTTFGSKAVAISGSASGAISVTGANAAWAQTQIELMQVAPAAGLQSSKVEVGGFLEPSAGLATSQAEVGAMLEPFAGLSASQLEIGAWLDVAPAGGRRRQLVMVS